MAARSDVHDRTYRLAKHLGIEVDRLAQLSSRRVVIEISEDAAASPVACLAFLTACNLATRLGPYVPDLYVDVPQTAFGIKSPIYPNVNSLREQALWVLRNATDVGDLVRDAAADSEAFDVALTIGESKVAAEERIYLGWDGWLGIVGGAPLPQPARAETNHFGALLAAAIAVGRLHAFQAAVIGGSIPRCHETWTLNALTLTSAPGGTPLPSMVALPSTLVVGGGALTSAIAYAMTHIRDLTGVVDAIDKDVLKPTNSNRQITAAFEVAATESVHKVEDLAAAWAAIHPEPLMYDEFKEQRGRHAGNYNLAVTAVDNTEARRQVALDLPRVLIDGATGGLMITLMRGSNPTQSCVACAYPELKTEEDDLWGKRLGHSREDIQMLRDGSKRFDSEVLKQIREYGTLILDEEREHGLLTEGWAYLKRAACGNAKLDRDLPAASVSYVSAICGFLMAAQMVGEVIGSPTLVAMPRWVWDDVLRQPPCRAQFETCPSVKSCAERHDMRSRIYQKRWPNQ